MNSPPRRIVGAIDINGYSLRRCTIDPNVARLENQIVRNAQFFT
jgi:hypothetical protein